MLQDKLGSRRRTWESRGLGVVGLRPTCFSSDLQESPEGRFGATLKATLLCGFPALALSSSQDLLSFPRAPARRQSASPPGSPEGQTQARGQGRIPRPQSPSGRQVSPDLPHARLRAHREGPGPAEELHGSSVCPFPRSPPPGAKKDGVGGSSFPACPASLPTPPWSGDSLRTRCSTAPGGGTGSAPAGDRLAGSWASALRGTSLSVFLFLKQHAPDYVSNLHGHPSLAGLSSWT